MSAEPFIVIQIESHSKEAIEQLGSKPKFWFLLDETGELWLFKFARNGTGEDWSEKIAAEVAALLNVPGAKVELAEFLGEPGDLARGSASLQFAKTEKGIDLIHGSEVLAGRVLGYDKNKKFHQSEHTVGNIFSAIGKVFPQEKDQGSLKTMAGFIILDALIGNTDRHHDNWGILRGPTKDGGISYQVAPSFDHASSLGRELTDEKRATILKEHLVENYVLKGRGALYWEPTARKGDNPLLLAQKTCEAYPALCRPWIERLRSLTSQDFANILGRIPNDRMSQVAKDFCVEMLNTTTKKLLEVKL